MEEKGISTNVHYKPLPMLTAYKNLGFDIEDYPNACRFIMTCNFPAKIIDALHEGRTMEFEFDFKKPEYVAEMKEQTVKRVEGILKYEKIKYDRKKYTQVAKDFANEIPRLIYLMCDKSPSEITKYVNTRF